MAKCPPAHGVPAGTPPSAFTKAMLYSLRKSRELRRQLSAPTDWPGYYDMTAEEQKEYDEQLDSYYAATRGIRMRPPPEPVDTAEEEFIKKCLGALYDRYR